MRIESYNVSQQSVSKFQRIEKNVVSAKIEKLPTDDELSFTDAGVSSLEIEENNFYKMSDADQRKIELLESFITWLTGEKFKFKTFVSKPVDNEDSEQSLKNNFRRRVYMKSEIYEKEEMSFSSNGLVKTADGKTIEFSYNLNMSRERYESSEVLFEQEFHDPLVLNFDGKGIDFSDKKIHLDLDLDGDIDTFNMIGKGSGFLAIDKNHNGKIDDGNELFGPRTNNGFSELREYDLDNNNWIDENDSIFKSLKIWMIGEDGLEQLIGLKEAGVGAIYLSDVASSYTLINDEHELGIIKGSSIYLTEDGKANVIHEVDIKI